MAILDYRVKHQRWGHTIFSSKVSEDKQTLTLIIFSSLPPNIDDTVLMDGKLGGELVGRIIDAKHTSPTLDPSDMWTIELVPILD